MRKTASEILRNLEMRVARLENKSASKVMDLMDLGGHLTKSLQDAFRFVSHKIKVRRSDVEMELNVMFNEDGVEKLFRLPYVEDDYSAYDDLSFEVKKIRFGEYRDNRISLEVDLKVSYASFNALNQTRLTLSVSAGRRGVQVKKIK